MKTRIAIVTVVMGLAAAVTAGAQQTRDQAKFCGSLNAFHADVATYNALGQNATVGEVRATARRVRDDAENVRRAAGSMTTPAAKQFDQAANNLKKDYNNMPENVTVQQAQDALKGDIDNLRSAAQQLATESGCPQVMPQQQQQQQQPY
jgi:hypothetical protein